MKLYIHYLKLHLKSLFEYKLSLILSIISQIFIFFSFTFVIISMFNKFSNIKGFTLYEVLLTFSIIHFGYATNEVFARGIDCFDELIVSGNYDRLLLRPYNIIIQILGYKIQYIKLIRVISSIIIMIYSIIKLNIKWTIYKVFILLLMNISSIIIFFGIFICAASYCFYTVQGLEVRNVFTDGGKNIAQYPIGIFNKYIRRFFTFIIPYAFVNYYPLLFILDKVNKPYYGLFPLLTIVYCIPCFLLFKMGSKRYMSTGS